MRSSLWAVVMLAAVALCPGTVRADDEQAAYDDVVIATQTQPKPAGPSADDARKAAIDHLEDVRAKCDAYLKKFPEGAHHLDVRLVDAQTMLVLGGQVPEKTALLDQVAALLQPVLDKAALTDKGVQARALLISLNATKMNAAKGDDVAKHRDEVLRQIDLFLKDYSKTPLAPQVLDLQAALFQQMGREADAKAVRERIIKDFPGTPVAVKADRDMNQRAIKGTVLALSFKSVAGEEIDLKNYRGKVVLVDFWASWCPPCKAAMPTIVALEKKYRDQGFALIGLSLDQDKKAMDEYIKGAGMTWPEYFDGQAWQSPMVPKYFVASIPASFLIDKKGVVREISLEPDKLDEAVKKLLAE